MPEQKDPNIFRDARERHARSGHIGTFGAAGLIVVVIILMINHYNGNSSSTEYTSDSNPTGSQYAGSATPLADHTVFVDRKTEYNGVGLKINTATTIGTPDELQSLKLNLSVSGLDTSKFNVASFGDASLVNQDIGSTVHTKLHGFTEPGMKSTDETFSLLDSYDIGQGHAFLLKMQDLYLIQREQIMLPAHAQVDKSYMLRPSSGVTQPTGVALEGILWEQGRTLTVTYRLSSTADGLSAQQVNMKSGLNDLSADIPPMGQNQSIQLSPQSTTRQGDSIQQQFAAPITLTEQEQEAMRLSFNYGKLVQKIEGGWTVPFELDEDQDGGERQS